MDNIIHDVYLPTEPKKVYVKVIFTDNIESLKEEYDLQEKHLSAQGMHISPQKGGTSDLGVLIFLTGYVTPGIIAHECYHLVQGVGIKKVDIEGDVYEEEDYEGEARAVLLEYLIDEVHEIAPSFDSKLEINDKRFKKAQ